MQGQVGSVAGAAIEMCAQPLDWGRHELYFLFFGQKWNKCWNYLYGFQHVHFIYGVDFLLFTWLKDNTYRLFRLPFNHYLLGPDRHWRKHW